MIVKFDGNYYTITYPQTFIEWLFGKKGKTKRFKESGKYFHFNITAFMSEDGEIISPISEECVELNKCKNRQSF